MYIVLSIAQLQTEFLPQCIETISTVLTLLWSARYVDRERCAIPARLQKSFQLRAIMSYHLKIQPHKSILNSLIDETRHFTSHYTIRCLYFHTANEIRRLSGNIFLFMVLFCLRCSAAVSNLFFHPRSIMLYTVSGLIVPVPPPPLSSPTFYRFSIVVSSW